MQTRERFRAARPAQLQPGVRVRLRGRGASYSLNADTGTVVGPDPHNESYYIVRLDTPATYYRADGGTESLAEILEAHDNLMVLEPARTTPPARGSVVRRAR